MYTITKEDINNIIDVANHNIKKDGDKKEIEATGKQITFCVFRQNHSAYWNATAGNTTTKSKLLRNGINENIIIKAFEEVEA